MKEFGKDLLRGLVMACFTLLVVLVLGLIVHAYIPGRQPRGPMKGVIVYPVKSDSITNN